ncbi:MAG: hypothetical protein KatS3mg087_0026 [Patescibacteria group bacterium]|nr:MAG: hypothetical protein KatS3mg087_0026 [Patescibacteria group bacterium]
MFEYDPSFFSYDVGVFNPQNNLPGRIYKFYRVGGRYIPSVPQEIIDYVSGLFSIDALGARERYPSISDEQLLNYYINYVYFTLLYGYCNTLEFSGTVYECVPGHFEQPLTNLVYGPIGPIGDGTYIIGKSPSYEEVKKRCNFKGDFGDFLRKTLRKFNIPQPYYFANVLRIDIRDDAQYVRFFTPLVLEELLILRPKRILCLGTRALKLFTRESLRSSYLNSFIYSIYHEEGKHDIEVFVAPLSALHNLSDADEFNAAIKYMHDRIYTPSSVLKDTGSDISYQVIDNERDLEAVVDEIYQFASEQEGVVATAWDLEWQGAVPGLDDAYVRTVAIALSPDFALVIKVCDDKGRPCINQGILSEQLTKLYTHPNLEIIGYNFMADLPWLESLGVPVWDKYYIPEDVDSPEAQRYLYPGIFDVIFAYHAVDETGKFGLEDAARIFLGVGSWFDKMALFLKDYYKSKEITGYGVVPDDILFPYTARDVIYTYRLFEKIAPRLKADAYGNPCWKPYWTTMKSIPGFVEMFKCGIDFDLERFLKLASRYIKKLEELIIEFRKVINWPNFNFRSHPQTVELLYGDKYLIRGKRTRPQGAITFNLEPISFTQAKSPSTDLEVCEALMRKKSEVRYLRDMRVLDQLAKNIFPDLDSDEPEGLLKFVQKDGKVHPSYSPLKETRRCSSSKPNMQNLSNNREETYKEILGDAYLYPIRSIFKAPDGYRIVSVDYTGAELLVLAVQSGDEKFIEDYYRSCLPDDDPNKLDIHSKIACLAFKLDCPPNKKGLESIGKLAYRLAAKRIIFGLNYGRSEESCCRQLQAQGVEITLDEVKQIVQTIYEEYKNVRPYQLSLIDWVLEHRYIANCFGSFRRFGKSRSSSVVDHIKREALNFVCQSAVADAVMLAMYELWRHPLKEKLGYRLALHNHDSLSLIVPSENTDVVVNEIIPFCMVERVKIRRVSFDGKVLDQTKQYGFGYSVSVSDRFC